MKKTKLIFFATILLLFSGQLMAQSDRYIVKTVDVQNPNPGDTVVFTITATNGTANSTAVTVTDLLPTGYTYVSSTPTVGIYTSASGAWAIGNMVANAEETLTITATVKATGKYVNTATIAATSPTDPSTSNNKAVCNVIPIKDSDGDGIYDDVDYDDDNDGIPDDVEVTCSSTLGAYQSFDQMNTKQTASTITVNTTSNANAPYSANTSQVVKYGQGYGKSIYALQYASGAQLGLAASSQKLSYNMRRNADPGTAPANEIFWMESKGSTTALASSILVSKPTSVVDIFNKGFYNVGFDNAFSNDMSTANQSNLERIDLMNTNGITTYSPTTEYAAVSERGKNDDIIIAAITAIDGSGIPTAFGPIITYSSANMLTLVSTGMYQTTIRKEPTDTQFRPHQVVSQSIGLALIKLSDMGLTTGQKYYGFALFPGDYSTATPLIWMNYPKTTTELTGGGGDFTFIDVFIQKCAGGEDIDNDGITNDLDLDSDDDGCLDAIEGGASILPSQLVLAAGTVTVGPSSTAPNKNLCAGTGCVDANGVPTIVGLSGQNVGDSQSASISSQCTDIDGDGIPDNIDLDDDNDGILDTVEGQCTSPSKTTTWASSSITQATGTAGSVGVTFNTIPLIGTNTNNSFTPTGAFNATNFWYNAAIAGSPSLEYQFAWDTSPEGQVTQASTDAGTRQITITFASPVNKLLLNIDRLGGSGVQTAGTTSYISNSTEFTLTTTGVTMNKLAGNNQLIVNGNKFYREPNVNLGITNPLGEANNTTGTAAGTIQIVKNDGSSFSSITFTITGIGVEGLGNDSIEMIFETCVDKDTDGDSIPDYLDLDSDNDGCPDAVEGGATFALSQLVPSVGSLKGGNGVDPAVTPTSGTYNQAVLQNLPTPVGTGSTTNGVPTIAGSGQTVGTSQDNAVKAAVCLVCYNPVTNTATGTDTNHGITLLKRAGADNGNWPMTRKSAHTVLESNTKGFVITRMTSDPAQTAATNHLNKITNPQEGMMVYDLFSKCLKIYADGVWSCFSAPTCP